MTELSPANEARLEALDKILFEMLDAQMNGLNGFRFREQVREFAINLLGELDAAQATIAAGNAVADQRNRILERLAAAETRLTERAEAAEQEVARLKEFPALILRIGHNDECLFCGFKDREATKMEQHHAD